jgi:cytochrome c oxidase subunit II
MDLDAKAARAAAVVMVVAMIAIGAYVSVQSAEPAQPVIKVTARKFNYTPAEVRLKQGAPVILEFESLDVIMGFNLPDFNVRADIVPGKVTRVRLVPDKAGTFVFLCDVFCGAGHEQMNGKLIVTE